VKEEEDADYDDTQLGADGDAILGDETYDDTVDYLGLLTYEQEKAAQEARCSHLDDDEALRVAMAQSKLEQLAE
jgi:hypothetical protein